jgi:membrane protein DedA with SNARE-associated domain
MTQALLGLVAAHGPLLVLAATFLSSMGLPVPGSLSLLAAGAFAAGGEMALGLIAGAGLTGAMLGDQVGYWFGAKGGDRASDWAARRGLGQAIPRARAFYQRWGDAGNFASRWLVSPLAPAVNLVSGVIGVPWARFTLACLLGETVWVALYVGLGHEFSRSILAIARSAGDLGLVLAAAVVALMLGLHLRSRPGADRLASTGRNR